MGACLHPCLDGAVSTSDPTLKSRNRLDVSRDDNRWSCIHDRIPHTTCRHCPSHGGTSHEIRSSASCLGTLPSDALTGNFTRSPRTPILHSVSDSKACNSHYVDPHVMTQRSWHHGRGAPRCQAPMARGDLHFHQVYQGKHAPFRSNQGGTCQRECGGGVGHRRYRVHQDAYGASRYVHDPPTHARASFGSSRNGTAARKRTRSRVKGG